MKKKILTGSIIVVFICAIAMCGLLSAKPNSVADATYKIDCYLFIEAPNNPIYNEATIITNRQAGIYLNPYGTADIMFFIRAEGSLDKMKITSNVTYLPIKDETTYYIGQCIPDMAFEFDFAQITYDLKCPIVSAKANNCDLNNNACVIDQQVNISAYDNLSGVQLYMIKDKKEPMPCEQNTYTIMEDGTYTFYAVDVAGNQSNDFTVTYYSEEPVKQPEEPDILGETATPINQTPLEEQDNDSENTFAQNAGIVSVVLIFIFASIVIVALIIYRKLKEKSLSSHIEDK